MEARNRLAHSPILPFSHSFGRRLLTALGCFGLVALAAWVFRPDPPPNDGRVHIRYWEKWTGFEEKAMRKVVDTFNARQSRIKVEMLSVSQVDQKMLLATAGGNPPDVAGLWDYNVVVYADDNALLPLGMADGGRQTADDGRRTMDDRRQTDETGPSSIVHRPSSALPLGDLCARDGIRAENYLPAYWDLCVHRGRVYALPTTPASVALHWNRKLFREAGLDPDRPPRTTEELDAMSDRLAKWDASGKITQLGFIQAEPGWWNWGWGCFFGGRLWDGQGRVTLLTPENLRAFRWVAGYSQRYGAKDLQVFQSGFGNFSSPQNAFMAGQVAMVLQGVWMANFIENNNPGMDWDAAPFPYPADRPDLAMSTPVGLDVLAIPTGAPHPAEAWDFIKYVQSQEAMEMLCLGQWKHSPLAKVSDRFLREHPNKRIKLFYDLAASRNTFSTPKVGIWREWQDEMKAAFENIWINGQDSEVALRYAQERIQPKLTRYLEDLHRRDVRLAHR
jgi:ABC-type glycerol-3-phosphate transport system substrate-binding protein